MQQLELWDLLPLEHCSQDIKSLLFPNPRQAQKLRSLADEMIDAIATKKNPPIASLPSTRRRARIADSLYQEALRLEQIQFWLYALADRAERGDCPPLLARITTKSQLEVLAAMSKDSWGEKNIFQAFCAVDGWYRDWVKKLSLAGIRTPRDCIKAIASLKELGAGHCRTAQEVEALEIAKLKREAVWQSIPDYFPTPKHLLDRMMDFAQIQPGMRVLEPSAGSGAIAERITEAGIQPDCFELSPTLREILLRQGFKLIGDDFMATTPKPIYDRVLMNPPFGKGMDSYHVERAFEWLNPGGRLISIVSCSYINYSSQKYQRFRSWLKLLGATELENPSGSFLKSNRRTNVETRMLVIDKPLLMRSRAVREVMYEENPYGHSPDF
jgi:hypothetical protein